ncbi:hypothetical protein [Actinoallomurus sp. NPDC050550]|uniref:SbtR family transcriptional regulator n=1 Tax=Actinoallomurus sp. NPDC050550 TaxID=3154937 RepID=UPI0033F55673
MVTDLAAGRLDEVAQKALSFDDAWEGFAYYIEKLCELQAGDPAVADVVSGRYPGADRLMAVCGRAKDTAERIIERAQRAGALRPDFTGEDLAFTFAANALLARAAADAAPDAWRRGVAFLLDGLRTEAATRPLPVGPPTPQQVYEVLRSLTGKP